MSRHHTILPHKSWHVWNAEAIAKVEADERKHAEEEAQKRKRQREIEAEARIERLRALAGKKPKVTDKESLPIINEYRQSMMVTEPLSNSQHEDDPALLLTDLDIELLQKKEHFNLFPEAARLAKREQEGHPEYLAEKQRREQREAEAFRSTFAAGANELKKNKPWYLQVEPQKPSPYIQRRIEKHNDSLDPLNDLNKMMHYKLIHDDPTYAEAVQNSTVTPKTSAYYDKSKPQEPVSQPLESAKLNEGDEVHKDKQKKDKHKHKHKHKKKKKKRRKYSSSSSSSSSTSSDSDSSDAELPKRKKQRLDDGLDIEKLRAERLAREAEERKRIAQLMGQQSPHNTRSVDSQRSVGGPRMRSDY